MSDYPATRGAKVILVPPPLIYGLSFALGMIVHGFDDDRIGGGPATKWLGAFLIAAGLVLAGSALGMFRRAHTTVIPHHRVSQLVVSGPFRFSRNPMYSALALLCLGGAFVAGSWWPIVTLIPALVIVRYWVIGPEERYLSGAFGADYEAYRRRVRRWL